jgi:hypothetical protein
MDHTQTMEKTAETAETVETVPSASPTPAVRRAGGCHCGAVRFEAAVALDRPGSRCNCSVCTKTSVTSGMVAPKDFELLSGEDSLRTYEWGAKISTRFFCGHCGVHCFGRGYLEEIGGHYVAVNLNCIDGFDPAEAPVIYWDGRHNNWEAGPRPTPWPVSAVES